MLRGFRLQVRIAAEDRLELREAVLAAGVGDRAADRVGQASLGEKPGNVLPDPPKRPIGRLIDVWEKSRSLWSSGRCSLYDSDRNAL